MCEPPHYQQHRSQRSRGGGANVASCVVATLFLLFLAIVAVTVFFFLFKPKDPRIAVEAVQFPAFSVSNGAFNFTLFQYASVTNPNRDAFTHYDSSLQLVYSGSPLGLVFIPAGQIPAGRTQHLSAKLDVHQFPLASSASTSASALPATAVGVADQAMEIETRMKLVGRVRVLKLFSHRVESGVRCRVAIRMNDGSVVGFHC
ncbi:uncharacterized protein LOC127787673 [Diospyros lotus]|uniref:uncharacterized protein LOC127787673 n=1 Tax=Diospyros lotus TaxID=55363 RepID=UPI00225B62B3|nr:uncharacterized protein LOC127787673 [Diospyros lotus]